MKTFQDKFKLKEKPNVFQELAKCAAEEPDEPPREHEATMDALLREFPKRDAMRFHRGGYYLSAARREYRQIKAGEFKPVYLA